MLDEVTSRNSHGYCWLEGHGSAIEIGGLRVGQLLSWRMAHDAWMRTELGGRSALRCQEIKSFLYYDHVVIVQNTVTDQPEI
eukprot:4114814-Pleurochrysis_carterae.AAC.1